MNADSGAPEAQDLAYSPVAAPAIGVSLQIDLGNGSVMILQTHQDQEVGALARATLHDQLFMDGERIKARVKIQVLDKQIEDIEKKVLIDKPQFERAEAHFSAEVAKITAEADAASNAAAEKFYASGRRGDYKPSGAEDTKQKAFARRLLELSEERAKAINGFSATEQMLQAKVTELQAERSALQAVVDAAYSPATR